MKSIKYLLPAIVIIGMICGLVGCSYNKNTITTDDYNTAKKNITLGCGLTALELKDLAFDFVQDVYNPSSSTDTIKGLDLLKPYMTNDEYNNLKSQLGSYNKSVKQTVSDMNVYFGPKEHMADHMDRLYIQFRLSGENSSSYKVVEFVFNGNNKIFKHYTWGG